MNDAETANQYTLAEGIYNKFQNMLTPLIPFHFFGLVLKGHWTRWYCFAEQCCHKLWYFSSNISRIKYHHDIANSTKMIIKSWFQDRLPFRMPDLTIFLWWSICIRPRANLTRPKLDLCIKNSLLINLPQFPINIFAS